MKNIINSLLFSAFFLIAPGVFAGNSDQSTSDSGVLVSPPPQERGSDHGSALIKADSDASRALDQGKPKSDASPKGNGTLATEDIVIKAANVAVSEMTAHLRLTQDQVNAVTPIITDNITKVRALQQSLENGSIDASTMYSQRAQLNKDEIQALSAILSDQQLKSWIVMQNLSTSHNRQVISK